MGAALGLKFWLQLDMKVELTIVGGLKGVVTFQAYF